MLSIGSKSLARGREMQMTFGSTVGMEPVVPVREDWVECAECGGYTYPSDSIEVDGRVLCSDCANSAGWAHCSDCGKVTDDNACSEDGDYYCQSCYDEKYVKCESCDCEVCKEDARQSDCRDWYCEECYNETFFSCEHCSSEVCNDSGRTDENGNCYCQSCYSDLYSSCETCGCEVHRDNVCYCERDGNAYCEDHYPGEGRDDAEWSHGRFRAGATCKEIRSQRKFGVELETSACPDHSDLEGNTCFDCREDGSIKGMEFTSPVLSSDAGLAAIRDFCHHAGQLDFEVDRDCGFHAHFDVKSLSAGQKSSVAYAYKLTYDVWAAFVNESRRNNHYCKSVPWDRSSLEALEDGDDWRRFSYNTDRYTWINLNAYSKHGTFEVRLHTATLDGDKVCNWIKAHTRFIDWARDKTLDELEGIFAGSAKSKFRALATIWADSELSDFYGCRAKKNGTDLTTVRKMQPVAV